jgi:hypothetical protein
MMLGGRPGIEIAELKRHVQLSGGFENDSTQIEVSMLYQIKV